MAEEELGHDSGLPQSVVKHAQKIFSDKGKIDTSIMGKVKSNWSAV
jgi:hypothetical protein